MAMISVNIFRNRSKDISGTPSILTLRRFSKFADFINLTHCAPLLASSPGNISVMRVKDRTDFASFSLRISSEMVSRIDNWLFLKKEYDIESVEQGLASKMTRWRVTLSPGDVAGKRLCELEVLLERTALNAKWMPSG